MIMKHSIAVTLIMTMAAGLANAQDKRPFKAPADINFRTGDIMSEGTRIGVAPTTPVSLLRNSSSTPFNTVTISNEWT